MTLDQIWDAGKETIVCLRDQHALLLVILQPLLNVWKEKSSVTWDLMLVAGQEIIACQRVQFAPLHAMLLLLFNVQMEK